MYSCEDLYKEAFDHFITTYYNTIMEDIEAKIRTNKLQADHILVVVPIIVKEGFFVFMSAQKIVDTLKDSGYQVVICNKDKENNLVSLYISWIMNGKVSNDAEINKYLEFSDLEDSVKENFHI